MKLSDILKEMRIFSQDIKSRFKNGQIAINGEVIKADVEIPISDFDKVIPAGDFIFNILNNAEFKNASIAFNILGVENLFGGETNINSALTRHLKDFWLLKISKKEFFVISLS